MDANCPQMDANISADFKSIYFSITIIGNKYMCYVYFLLLMDKKTKIHKL